MGSTTDSCSSSSWTAAAGLALLLAGSAAAQGTSLVSVVESGHLPNDDAYDPVISPDGRYVAFQWYANFTEADIFLKDRETGDIERISVDSNGVRGNSYSYGASITPDLRYVAFSSFANNLVADDDNGTYPDPTCHDIFVRDRLNGTTERVSIGSLGEEGNDASWHPAISADGRYVAFTSYADNLVASDANGVEDVFLRDRVAGTTELVSLDSSGAQADGGTFCSGISADGRYVVFYGSAANLVAGDTNGSTDVFVRDRLNGTTECMSVDPSGLPGDASSDSGAITPDGRFVAFRSSADDLVPGDTNGKADVFVRDRQTGTTERLSVDSSGAQGDDDSWIPALTPDGRFAAFQSRAANLVVGDANGSWDVFVRDRLLGTTERVSVDTNGAEGDADSGIRGPVLSQDGRYVAFDSSAHLVPDDTDGWHDIYVRDRGPEPPSAYCASDTTTHGCNATISSTGTPSASAGSGFDVTISSVEGEKLGLVFWGAAPVLPWNMGTNSLCVVGPIQRTGRQSSGGMAGRCDGVLSLDFNAWMAAHPSIAPAVGTTVYMQGWFRDPPSPTTTGLSDALLFTVGP